MWWVSHQMARPTRLEPAAAAAPRAAAKMIAVRRRLVLLRLFMGESFSSDSAGQLRGR